jgi:hypothetical protein
VVVAHENRVAMGETLEEGLNLLFGTGTSGRPLVAAAGDASAAGPADVGLLSQAQQHYDRAIAAQRAGDWSAYGREIDQLGTILKQLRARKP